ncbi:MAG: hypothetical protein ACLQUY_23260, partial [Ktedonobacterales bacterium]
SVDSSQAGERGSYSPLAIRTLWSARRQAAEGRDESDVNRFEAGDRIAVSKLASSDQFAVLALVETLDVPDVPEVVTSVQTVEIVEIDEIDLIDILSS